MISVIIPVYNVEKYLHYAMESLLRQTYTKFEVILVNDGSTDNSGRLCEGYAMQHKNVQVYHKENGGLSDARNFGVKMAKFNWIFFLDPDDYIEPFTLELLVMLRKKYNANLISTKVQPTSTYEMTANTEFIDLDLRSTKKVSKEEALKLMLENNIATVSACAKLYHKELLQKTPFPVGKIYEDFYVIAEHIHKAEKVVISPIVTYHYYTRPNSIVNSKFTRKQYDFFEAVEHNREILKKYYTNQKMELELDSKMVKGTFAIASLAAESCPTELNTLRKKIIPFYKKIVFSNKKDLTLKLMFSLFILSPRAFCKLKKLLKKRGSKFWKKLVK